MTGVVALAAAAALYSVGLWALRRFDPGVPRWWYGYARDGANMAGFLMFSGGLALAGLPGHLALLAGAALALSIYGLDYLLARSLRLTHATALHLVAALVLATALGLAARPLERGLAALLEGLF